MGGMWGGEGSRERGYVYTLSDSHCCTAENNTTLESNYPPIKKERKEGRKEGREGGGKGRKKKEMLDPP